MTRRKHYRNVKKTIRKNNLADSYFTCKYLFSPYQACEHGCVYCDGRAEKYYVEGDFERDIVIRKNQPEILRKDLTKLREKGTILIGSGISDSYQPVEKEEKLMRYAAEVLTDFNFPVSVMTKSSLILRDLDIWQKIQKKNGFILMVSLALTDERLRGIFEPAASTIEDRLDMLRRFKAAGCFTGVLAMPFLPFIADSIDDIKKLSEKLESIGIDFILPGTLTLRPGRQKQFFFNTLRKYFPEFVNKYKKIYGLNKPSGSPLPGVTRDFHRKFESVFSKTPIHQNIPHYIYRNHFPLYDEIYILMSHMISLYSRRGTSVEALQDAFYRYASWLKTERKEYNRRRSWHYQYLENRLRTMIDTGEIYEIIKNEKLTIFLQQVTLERKQFNYLELTLTD
ncbi:hypothetical protein K8T06_05510 [bacterium]|nr:hypothetical protein [bacterium]